MLSLPLRARKRPRSPSPEEEQDGDETDFDGFSDDDEVSVPADELDPAPVDEKPSAKRLKLQDGEIVTADEDDTSNGSEKPQDSEDEMDQDEDDTSSKQHPSPSRRSHESYDGEFDNADNEEPRDDDEEDDDSETGMKARSIRSFHQSLTPAEERLRDEGEAFDQFWGQLPNQLLHQRLHPRDANGNQLDFEDWPPALQTGLAKLARLVDCSEAPELIAEVFDGRRGGTTWLTVADVQHAIVGAQRRGRSERVIVRYREATFGC